MFSDLHILSRLHCWFKIKHMYFHTEIKLKILTYFSLSSKLIISVAPVRRYFLVSSVVLLLTQYLFWSSVVLGERVYITGVAFCFHALSIYTFIHQMFSFLKQKNAHIWKIVFFWIYLTNINIKQALNDRLIGQKVKNIHD